MILSQITHFLSLVAQQIIIPVTSPSCRLAPCYPIIIIPRLLTTSGCWRYFREGEGGREGGGRYLKQEGAMTAWADPEGRGRGRRPARRCWSCSQCLPHSRYSSPCRHSIYNTVILTLIIVTPHHTTPPSHHITSHYITSHQTTTTTITLHHHNTKCFMVFLGWWGGEVVRWWVTTIWTSFSR